MAPPKNLGTFSECMDHLQVCAGANATVRALGRVVGNPSLELPSGISEEFAAYAMASAPSHGPSATQYIAEYLAEKFNAKKFVPMVTSARQANIAAVFYAGDGIVVKVTAGDYMPKELRPVPGGSTHIPGVVFPLHTADVAGFKVEVFPWLDRKKIKSTDVAEMAEILKGYNLQFKKGDDRTDNLGKLPDGTLTILDGDAVELIPGTTLNTRDINRWTDRVYKNFAPLYTAAKVNGSEVPILKHESQRDPDFFEERFSSLIGRGEHASKVSGREEGESRFKR